MSDPGRRRRYHELYRGFKPDPSENQPKQIACAFCQKQFATTNAARDHERAYHRKYLRKYMRKLAMEQKDAR